MGIKVLYNYIKREIGWMPFLVAVVMSCKTLGFHFFPVDIVSYGVLIFVAILVCFHGIQYDTLTLLFLAYIPISIALAGPDPIFNSWGRYALFAMVFIAASPFIINSYARGFRTRILKGILICCVVISLISFFCYFLGINMMRNTFSGEELDYLVNKAGTFGGITSQSMLLGPISGIAVIVCTYLAINRDKRFWLLVIICGASLLFAASRSSLIATLIGEIILFYFSTKNLGKNTQRIVFAVSILLLTNPLWNNALDGIREKNQGAISEGINLDSRDSKWSMRIEEWKDSPLYGIGFCSVSSRDRVGYNGMIEPGSSWLAVLSMTGAVGFILFCLIFYRAAKKSLRPHTPEGAFLGGILIMLGVHMFAEGHIFSGGSFLCFLVWISIGCATDYRQQK